jgi:hypothetical protein
MHIYVRLLLTPLLLASGHWGLLAQNVALDEGAFRVSIDGQVVGREEFSIRRAGVGRQARVVLRGTVQLDAADGERSLAPALEAGGPELTVMAYQMKVSGSVTSDIYVSRVDQRFLAKVVSQEGEQLREFRAGPGSILLDHEVAHHFFLLTPYLEEESAVSLTILAPRAGRQTRMTLTQLGRQEIRVGARLVNARRYRLEAGDRASEVWYDDQGRVLRVEVPSVGYLADREILP